MFFIDLGECSRFIGYPASMGILCISGGLQVKSHELVVQHLYGHHKYGAISVPISFPRPNVSCLIITDCPVIMSTGYSQ